MLPAQAVYTIHLPEFGAQAKFAVRASIETAPASGAGSGSATRVGDWEVTVAVDLSRCEIYCVYRQRRDGSGRTPVVSLLPPVTVIRVYGDPASAPTTVIVDPAGLRLPVVGSLVLPIRDEEYIPGRKLFTAALDGESGSKAPSSDRAHFVRSAIQPETAFCKITPLRI